VLEVQRTLEDEQRRALEQQNLLRFKVEVMVNMLAMEEKKNELMVRRLETLKHLLVREGVTEQVFMAALQNATTGGEGGGGGAASATAGLCTTAEDHNESATPQSTTSRRTALLAAVSDSAVLRMGRAMAGAVGASNTSATGISAHTGSGSSVALLSPVDVSGAMQRTAREFDRFRADIFCAFAAADMDSGGFESSRSAAAGAGRLVVSLSHEEFVKQLYVVTEELSKTDIQVRQA
jgi:hypothetical protein